MSERTEMVVVKNGSQFLACPNCGEALIPPDLVASEEHVTEDIEIGDPLWTEGRDSYTCKCGTVAECMVDSAGMAHAEEIQCTP